MKKFNEFKFINITAIRIVLTLLRLEKSKSKKWSVWPMGDESTGYIFQIEYKLFLSIKFYRVYIIGIICITNNYYKY